MGGLDGRDKVERPQGWRQAPARRMGEGEGAQQVDTARARVPRQGEAAEEEKRRRGENWQSERGVQERRIER